MFGHLPATMGLAGRKRHARFESSEALAELPAVARTAVELHGCCARVWLAEALLSQHFDGLARAGSAGTKSGASAPSLVYLSIYLSIYPGFCYLRCSRFSPPSSPAGRAARRVWDAGDPATARTCWPRPMGCAESLGEQEPVHEHEHEHEYDEYDNGEHEDHEHGKHGHGHGHELHELHGQPAAHQHDEHEQHKTRGEHL